MRYCSPIAVVVDCFERKGGGRPLCEPRERKRKDGSRDPSKEEVALWEAKKSGTGLGGGSRSRVCSFVNHEAGPWGTSYIELRDVD